MLANLNQAIDYIEEHLTEEVSFDELAKKTGISVYHFKRTFSFIAGMSLAEYIKKRRFHLHQMRTKTPLSIGIIPQIPKSPAQ